MSLRKLLLRVMLISLGAAAALGTMAILLSSTDTIWRICGTAGATAAAAGLMIAASILMDRPNGRNAGMLALGVILLEYFGTVILIWDFWRLLPGRQPDEAVALTMVWLFICTPPAMAFLRGRPLAVARIASNVGLTVAGVTFTLLLIATWIENLALARGQMWFESSAMVGWIGLAVAGALIGIDQPRDGLADRLWLVLRGMGALAGLAAIAIGLYAVWNRIHSDTGLWTTLISISVVATHANLCRLAPLTPGQQWLRIATIAAGVATAIGVDLCVTFDAAGHEIDALIRVASASGLITSCGSLALIVLTRMNRRVSEAPPVLEAIREITLICPACGRKQTLPAGTASCPDCRLRIFTRFEEPRCVGCEYLLFNLKSDRCPECGTPVAQSLSAG